MVAIKFVNYDVPGLEFLENQKIYILRVKLNNGYRLSIEEKAFITKEANTNSYFKNAVPLWGWKFDFSDVLKKFVVKQYGSYQEYYGFNKMSVRRMLYGRIETILEA